MTDSLLVGFEKMTTNCVLPRKMSDGAGGYDLFSPVGVTVPANSRVNIPLGLKLQIAEGYYAIIGSRSGLASRHGITVFNGIIDSDYRGVVSVLVFNDSNEPYNVSVGDRIAQILFYKAYNVKFVETSLSPSVRGEMGFGSTGY